MGIKLRFVDLAELTLLILRGINHDPCMLLSGHHDE